MKVDLEICFQSLTGSITRERLNLIMQTITAMILNPRSPSGGAKDLYFITILQNALAVGFQFTVHRASGVERKVEMLQNYPQRATFGKFKRRSAPRLAGQFFAKDAKQDYVDSH